MKNDSRNDGNENNYYTLEDSFVWETGFFNYYFKKNVFGLLIYIAEMSYTVSRKACTVKSSTQKKKRKEGKKWNRTAHLLEKYITVLLGQLGN